MAVPILAMRWLRPRGLSDTDAPLEMDANPEVKRSPAPRLIGTPRKRTVSAREVFDGQAAERLISGRAPRSDRKSSGAAAPGRGGRMSRQRKTAAVLRLLRGEDLETVSRSLGVTAATLSAWRDAFLDRR